MKYHNQDLSMSQVVGTNFIQMAKMNSLVAEAFEGSNATCISLYIDTYSIIRQVLQSQVSFKYDLELVHLIIDLCCHYRRYFKGIGVDTKIYIVDTFNTPAYARLKIPTYNSAYSVMLTSAAVPKIMSTMSSLGAICKSLRDIHYVRSDASYEASVIIYGIMRKVNDGLPSVILSRDSYNMQVICNVNGTAYLRPSKSKGEDKSRICYNPYTMWKEIAYTLGAKEEDLYNLPPNSLPILWSLSKMPDRSIKSLYNVSKAASIIRESIVAGSMFSPYATQVQEFKNVNNLDKLIQEGIIKDRYECLNAECMIDNYLHSAEYLSMQLTNVYDVDSLKLINNRYFDNQLDLDGLS